MRKSHLVGKDLLLGKSNLEVKIGEMYGILSVILTEIDLEIVTDVEERDHLGVDQDLQNTVKLEDLDQGAEIDTDTETPGGEAKIETKTEGTETKNLHEGKGTIEN